MSSGPVGVRVNQLHQPAVLVVMPGVTRGSARKPGLPIGCGEVLSATASQSDTHVPYLGMPKGRKVWEAALIEGRTCHGMLRSSKVGVADCGRSCFCGNTVTRHASAHEVWITGRSERAD